MVLIHDDDLAQLGGIYESTVGRCFKEETVVLMYSYFQQLDSIQSNVMLSHIRSPKLTVYNSRIGELLQYRNFSITHSGGIYPKDLSSADSSASTGPDTESTWVATLSNIFEMRSRFHVF